MTINEISEDLQSQFGKPRNQTEANIRYVLTLVAEHVKGLNLKMVQGFMKLTRALYNEEHPSKLIEYVINPAHYDDIVNGLHKLIHYGQDEHAALNITCAIEDGIIAANVSAQDLERFAQSILAKAEDTHRANTKDVNCTSTKKRTFGVLWSEA